MGSWELCRHTSQYELYDYGSIWMDDYMMMYMNMDGHVDMDGNMLYWMDGRMDNIAS